MEQLAVYSRKPVRDTFLIFSRPRIEEDEITEVADYIQSGITNKEVFSKIQNDSYT